MFRLLSVCYSLIIPTFLRPVFLVVHAADSAVIKHSSPCFIFRQTRLRLNPSGTSCHLPLPVEALRRCLLRMLLGEAREKAVVYGAATCGDCEDVLRNAYGRHCLRRSRVCRRMKQNGRAFNPPRSPQRERLRKRV